ERGSWDPLQSKTTGAPTSPLRSAPGGRGSVSADPGRVGGIAGGWNEAARAPGARGRDERYETRFRDQYRNDMHEDRGAILFLECLTAPLKSVYDWLLDTGLDTNVVFTLVKQLHDRPPVDDEQLAVTLRTSVLDLMVRGVKIAGPLLDEEAGPKAVMIVGPSGVGKTTTIAKLAAFYALREKRNVALITLDTYRVAAVEQLRVYGSILGISVDVALTCED